MKTVGQLLKAKGNQVWSINPDRSVLDALRMLAEKDVGALLVLEEEEVVGIFSERDYARKIILKGKTSRETQVREIMSKKVFYVTPDQAIEECMALMTMERIRHLPVLDDGKLAGIISIGDVVKTIISNQQFMIDQLEKYITGKR
jgi:CBS domain-containing protein